MKGMSSMYNVYKPYPCPYYINTPMYNSYFDKNEPYAAYLLPPAPNQDPSPDQKPPKGYNPEGHNYPANINYVAPGFTYKLRPDEAIVLIGKTPPPAYYFSYRSYLGFVQNKLEKDSSDSITTGNDYTGVYHFIGASMGDPKASYPTLNPWPIPTLKIKETGTTEFLVVSNARNELDYIRNQIINKYGREEYNHVDLDTNFWVLDGYEGILWRRVALWELMLQMN